MEISEQHKGRLVNVTFCLFFRFFLYALCIQVHVEIKYFKNILHFLKLHSINKLGDTFFFVIDGWTPGYTFHGDAGRVFKEFFGGNNPFAGK